MLILVVTLGVGHTSFICDVTSAQSVSELFTKVKQTYDGRVPSVYVLAAGICPKSSLLDTEEEVFDKVVGVNLKVRCTDIWCHI